MSASRPRRRETPPAQATIAQAAIVIRVTSPAWRGLVPQARALCRRAARAALAATRTETKTTTRTKTGGEIVIVLADDATLRALNRDFRGKDKPTNVLAFPGAAGGPEAGGALGDVAIAAETVASEARDQGKTVPHHLAHLVVHGVLHLLGYTHDRKADAARMERLETEALAGLGISDPYVAPEPAPMKPPALHRTRPEKTIGRATTR